MIEHLCLTLECYRLLRFKWIFFHAAQFQMLPDILLLKTIAKFNMHFECRFEDPKNLFLIDQVNHTIRDPLCSLRKNILCIEILEVLDILQTHGQSSNIHTNENHSLYCCARANESGNPCTNRSCFPAGSSCNSEIREHYPEQIVGTV